MSKIELTEEQVREVYQTFMRANGYEDTVRTTLEKAIELGLVRPATDDPMQREWEDVKARVVALEAETKKNREALWHLSNNVAALQVRANVPSPQPPDPPPGWEKKPTTSEVLAKHAQEFVAPKPRTEADRLGELCRKAWWGGAKHAKWEDIKDAQEAWREAALAVRKADRASQLEPSEEERAAALSAWDADGGNDKTATRAALRAAARVRLEKAEGEKP